MRGIAVMTAAALGVACSGHTRHAPADAAPVAAPDGGDDAAFAAELELLPLGLPSIEAYGYALGPGQRHLRRALAARAKGDWRAVRAACEDAILADPGHLEAHRLLASALAMLGEPRGVARHLSIAVAGDYMRYGVGLERDPTLASVLGGPRGAQVRAMLDGYRAAFVARASKGLLVVARRAPATRLGPGARDVFLRAEIYAWDADGQRFLRVSRTNGGVAAFVRSPAGDRLAYVAYGRARGGAGGARSLLLDARVGAVDLGLPAMSPRALHVPEARALRVGWDDAGHVVVTSGDLDGPDARLARTVQVDLLHGRGRDPGRWQPAGGAAVVTADGATLDGGAPADVEADWDEDGGAGAFRVSTTNKTVTLPTGEHARRASFAWSPGKARLAFATRADACAADPAAREVVVYVVEAATGRQRPVARGEGLGVARWLDDDRLAMEDGAGGVRVLDVAGDGRELVRLSARGGLGLGRVPVPGACPGGAESATPDRDSGAEPPEDDEPADDRDGAP
jgi:hypothetical protein